MDEIALRGQIAELAIRRVQVLLQPGRHRHYRQSAIDLAAGYFNESATEKTDGIPNEIVNQIRTIIVGTSKGVDPQGSIVLPFMNCSWHARISELVDQFLKELKSMVDPIITAMPNPVRQDRAKKTVISYLYGPYDRDSEGYVPLRSRNAIRTAIVRLTCNKTLVEAGVNFVASNYQWYITRVDSGTHLQ